MGYQYVLPYGKIFLLFYVKAVFSFLSSTLPRNSENSEGLNIGVIENLARLFALHDKVIVAVRFLTLVALPVNSLKNFNFGLKNKKKCIVAIFINHHRKFVYIVYRVIVSLIS